MLKIAQKLKKKNIAEYLIYMWQVEDMIRAYHLDLDAIKQQLINPTSQSLESQEDEIQWYEELIDMMYAEGVKDKGHLQINQNIIISLTDLHNQLISCTKYPFYNSAYYKALPFIVELRAKNKDEEKTDIEISFDALYGLMLLRLQKKDITPETNTAVKAIASFLSMLASYYAKDKAGELKFDE